MTDLTHRWSTIAYMIETMRADTGYLAIQPYTDDHGGRQIGRFDLCNDEHERYWLEAGPPVSEDSETAMEAPEVRPVEIDEDEEGEGEGEGVEDEEEEGEDDAEGEGGEDEDEEDAEDEEGEEEGAGPPEEGAGPSEEAAPGDGLSARARAHRQVRAIHKWLVATCEANTPTGGNADFRLRIYQTKGNRQLWSTLFTYVAVVVGSATSTATALATDAAAVAADAADPPIDNPFSSEWSGLSADEQAIAEMLAMPESSDPISDVLDPMRLAAAERDDLQAVVADPTSGAADAAVEKAHRAGRGPGARVAAGEKGPAPYEIRTILHLHGLHRETAAWVLGTAKEVTRLQADAMKSVAGMLRDVRQREDELVQTIHGMRLADAEAASEAAGRQDNVDAKVILGTETIQQLGLLGRVLLAGRRRRSPSKEEDEGMNGADRQVQGTEQRRLQKSETDEGEETDEEAVEETDEEAVEETEEETKETEEETKEGEAPAVPGAENVADLVQWLNSRPDIAAALRDPNVQAYLKPKANVGQLRTLAEAAGSFTESLDGDDEVDDPADPAAEIDDAPDDPTDVGKK